MSQKYIQSPEEFDKDIKLNLSNILNDESTAELSKKQKLFIMVSVAYGLKNKNLVKDILADHNSVLNEQDINGAKIVATIMAMNNVYYRASHFSEDDELQKESPRLRMNMMIKHGLEKLDFEIACLAVSAVEGCQKCVSSHIAALKTIGANVKQIQTTLRIAAVINAMNTAILIKD